jgi:hypothetical protein
MIFASNKTSKEIYTNVKSKSTFEMNQVHDPEINRKDAPLKILKKISSI